MGPLGDLACLYTEDYYNGAEYINYSLGAPVYRRNFVRKLKEIRKRIPELQYKDMRVLEIGSATGDFLQVLKDHGVNTMLGVEASEYSRERAQRKGFEILNPFTADYLARVHEFSPNVICAWDVWEHLEFPSDVFDTLIVSDLKEDRLAQKSFKCKRHSRVTKTTVPFPLKVATRGRLKKTRWVAIL